VRLPQGDGSSAFRASLYWDTGQRFSLRFVAAPLSTATDFVPTSPVFFNGVTFQPGESVTTDYRFDTSGHGLLALRSIRGLAAGRAPRYCTRC
jgi:hypothetical protein